jgi:hypothetical protein
MSLETRKRILEVQLERAAAELFRLEQLPTDDFEDGAILRFDKRFGGPTSFAYSYVFLKCSGAWYGTGPKQRNPQRWEELLEFISSGVDEVWMVTDFELVEELGNA